MLLLVWYYKIKALMHIKVAEQCPDLLPSVELNWFLCCLPVPMSLTVNGQHLCPPGATPSSLIAFTCSSSAVPCPSSLVFLSCAVTPLFCHIWCPIKSPRVPSASLKVAPCFSPATFSPYPPVVRPDCLGFHSQFNYSSCPQWISVCPS